MYIFTLSSLLSVLSVAFSKPLPGSPEISPRQLPPSQNGTYTVSGCNDEYHREVITSLIGRRGITGDISNLIRPELALGQSSILYSLIFKDPSLLPQVLNTFDRIARHDTISYGQGSQGIIARTNLTVNFLCITEAGAEQGFRAADYQWWVDHLNATIGGPTAAPVVGLLGSSHYWTTESAQVSPDIWMWPSFFDDDYIPALPTYDLCPLGDYSTPTTTAVNSTSRQASSSGNSTNSDGLSASGIGDGNYLIRTQYGGLIQGLANKYLSPNPIHTNETIMDVLNMDGPSAVANPASYAWFITALKAGCDLSILPFLDNGETPSGP